MHGLLPEERDEILAPFEEWGEVDRSQPFPEWATAEKNSIWIYDATRFRRCGRSPAVATMHLGTRKWLTTVVSAEETSTQVRSRSSRRSKPRVFSA